MYQNYSANLKICPFLAKYPFLNSILSPVAKSQKNKKLKNKLYDNLQIAIYPNKMKLKTTKFVLLVII
jgi:hypothetical protein